MGFLRLARSPTLTAAVISSKRRRSPQRLVRDRDQTSSPPISARKIGTPERETGVRALVTRACRNQVRNWGLDQGYFKTPEDGAPSTTNSFTFSSASTPPSTRPSVQRCCDRIEPNSDARKLALESSNPASRVRRHRLQQSTMLGVFYKLGKRFAGFHSHSPKTEGIVFQVGKRHRNQSLSAAASSTEGPAEEHRQRSLSFIRFRCFRRIIKSEAKLAAPSKMVIPQCRPYPDIGRSSSGANKKKKPKPCPGSSATMGPIPIPTPTLRIVFPERK